MGKETMSEEESRLGKETTSEEESSMGKEKTSEEEEWSVRHTTCEEESRLGKDKMDRGDWSGIGQAIMGASWSGGAYDFAEGRVLDNELLGLPVREDLRATVAKVVRGELAKEVGKEAMMITADLEVLEGGGEGELRLG